MYRQPDEILRPRALKPGDRIGIAAPASPFDRNLFLKGVAMLEQMGFGVIYDESLFQTTGYLAGPDANRLALFQDLFADPEIKAIWCARGGYGSLRLLPGIDFAALRRMPKLFIGCSDISALLNALYTFSGMISLHGPMVTGLGGADRITIDSIRRIILETEPVTIEATWPRVICPGKARGPVLGGNLATLCHLLGTPYMPDFAEAIVFLEDVGEKPYRIDRMLTQMQMAGCFDRVAGLCFGTFENCGESSDIARIIDERFGAMPVPVLSGFAMGHGSPNLALPIGLEALLDTDSASLSYGRAPVM